jgi:hypothetical protein
MVAVGDQPTPSTYTAGLLTGGEDGLRRNAEQGVRTERCLRGTVHSLLGKSLLDGPSGQSWLWRQRLIASSSRGTSSRRVVRASLSPGHRPEHRDPMGPAPPRNAQDLSAIGAGHPRSARHHSPAKRIAPVANRT